MHNRRQHKYREQLCYMVACAKHTVGNRRVGRLSNALEPRVTMIIYLNPNNIESVNFMMFRSFRMKTSIMHACPRPDIASSISKSTYSLHMIIKFWKLQKKNPDMNTRFIHRVFVYKYKVFLIFRCVHFYLLSQKQNVAIQLWYILTYIDMRQPNYHIIPTPQNKLHSTFSKQLILIS